MNQGNFVFDMNMSTKSNGMMLPYLQGIEVKKTSKNCLSSRATDILDGGDLGGKKRPMCAPHIQGKIQVSRCLKLHPSMQATHNFKQRGYPQINTRHRVLDT